MEEAKEVFLGNIGDNMLVLESIDRVHNIGPLNANAELFNTGI